ncbi:MAG: hypothetical protein DSM106950_15085 [Stigonema ocellatum SAG 48.90 = DSM 106950]|nr:hypothetical protein [Stigonema ocellatum SAG 48.90 = DSM 106950]
MAHILSGCDRPSVLIKDYLFILLALLNHGMNLPHAKSQSEGVLKYPILSLLAIALKLKKIY